MLVKGINYARKCSECGRGMNEGYVIGGGCEHYCSDYCLHKHVTHEEFLELYDDGDGDSYYTEWENETGDEGEQDNNELREARQLAATAPDLLAALEGAYKHFLQHMERDWFDDDDQDVMQQMFDAINKARKSRDK
jgi:hypothetical protein